ncbi:MAG: hypothetical protein GY861_27070 [bacterium]|nr:hypothetical protein [bacterium]
MALSPKQYAQIRKELEECSRPLFFLHDDPDGLASFLLLYRFCKEGKAIIVKATPNIDDKYIRKVEEYCPDKIFVADIAIVQQEFIDTVKTPIVWIDHHEPLERYSVKYFNPRVEKKDDNIPASVLCYNAVQQDLWIAMVGAVGDWYFPDFAGEFVEKYPELLDKKIKDPETALFESKLGELCRVFSFVLKGKTEDALSCLRVLTRIESPSEILNQETSKGKFIYKRYKQVNDKYQKLLATAEKNAKKSKLLVYTYSDTTSFTGDLANELLHKHPNRIILIGREKSGEIRMSIRSKKQTVPKRLEKALIGVQGYGGGHEYACGAAVKKEDFKRFVENLEKEF